MRRSGHREFVQNVGAGAGAGAEVETSVNAKELGDKHAKVLERGGKGTGCAWEQGHGDLE